ncbi:MAG: bacterial Ig-like domain-containing protein, partial [Clostridia bacterium]|nr:bacterial Ig-like domain-containing protein [Clostridia bacterium]
MRKAKSVSKKALSVLLTVAMLLTTFVFFDIGSMIGSAASVDSTFTVTDNAGDQKVYFYVPEAAYLEPSITAQSTQARYNYQWFVDSEIDPTTHEATPRSGENATGNFYFYYEYASQVIFSFRYLDANRNPMTAYTLSSTTNADADYANANSTIKFASSSSALKAVGTSTVQSHIQYVVPSNTLSTTITQESISPYLLGSTNGYYIEWTATFTDSRDGLSKVATAYTYVYKPLVQPVVVSIRNLNTTGDNHYLQDVSWMSGYHSLQTTGNRYPSSALGGNGIATLSSSNSSKGVVLDEEGLYAQFANAIDSQSYFHYTQSGNQNAGDWIPETADDNFKLASGYYVSYEAEDGSTSNVSTYVAASSPIANIMVDTSRYSNMNQIPNISIGLMITDEDATSGDSTPDGGWYVANYNGSAPTSDQTGKQKGSKTNSENLWNDVGTIMKSEGSATSDATSAAARGLKANIRWNRDISTSGEYTIKTAARHEDSGDTAWNFAYLRINVTVNDKSTLREAVYAVNNKLADLSIASDGTSPYYDTTSSYWTDLVALYNAAGQLLANLDTMTSVTVNGNEYSCGELAEALTTALANVENCRLSSTATARFLAVKKATDGGYVLTGMYDIGDQDFMPDVTANYNFGDTVTATSNDHIGYKYIGYSTDLTYSSGDAFKGDYNSLVVSSDATVTKNMTTDENICYTFFYMPESYDAIIDTRGGEFNYLKIKTTGLPSDLGGIGYPSYRASSSVDTDINYDIDGNTVTAWTSAETTNIQNQFLPYYVDLTAGTTYNVSYKVTGTDASNVALSLYNAGFIGGNGDTTQLYDMTQNSSFTVSASDSGRAYIKLELMNDARNGKAVMISDICISAADTNVLYLETSTEYPASFTATSADKTGMSYVASDSKLTVTSQYNSLTYQQKQFLPYYLSMKQSSNYMITYDVSGVEASQVHFVLYNSDFSGGNGTTANYYDITGSGTTFTAGANDNGIAQLRVELTSVAANTKATITNLKIVNTDSQTVVSGLFNDTIDLGIPVKEGYHFDGWTVETVTGNSAYSGYIGKAVDNVSVSNCIDNADMIWIPSQNMLNINFSDNVETGSSFYDIIDFDIWGANGFTAGDTYTLTAKVRVNSLTSTANDEANADRAVIVRNAGVANDATNSYAITTATGEWIDVSIPATFTADQTPRFELAFYIGEKLATLAGVEVVSANIDLKDVQVKDDSGKVIYNFADSIGSTSSGQLNRYRYGATTDMITAVWSTDTCKVIFRDALGNNISVQEVPYGGSATAPEETPEVVGSTFVEWSEDFSAVTSDMIVDPVFEEIDITVNLDKSTLTLYAGDEDTITATFDPDVTGISAVEWTSDKESVATVDENGVVKAVSAGTANITATVTYAGRTYSAKSKVTVNAVEVTSIAINTNPDKTEYFVGEQLDTTGLTLTVNYNNGKSDVISEGFEIGTFSSTVAGTKTVKVTYSGKQTTFKVKVVDIVITEISVQTLPDKTEYFVGDSAFDASGLTILATYNNGDTDILTEDDVILSGFTSANPGEVTITVEYEDLSTTFNVTVKAVELTSIAVKTMPNKTEYFTDDALDTTGLTLTATYNNGTTATVTEGFTVSGYVASKTGTQTLTVEYQGETTTFDVVVKSVEVSSIAVNTMPKAKYFVGEDADFSALSITVLYNNGTSTVIMDGFTTDGFSSDSVGTKTITVSYSGFTTTFDVEIVAPEIVSIAVKTNPTKLVYKPNETVDLTGLVLTASYNDGSSKDVTEGYTAGDVDFSTSGQKTVTVYYNGFSTTFNVEVLAYADYTAVESAKTAAAEKLAAESEVMTEESKTAINDAVNAVVEGLTIDEQSRVDAMAEAITNAIANVQYLPLDETAYNTAVGKIPSDLSIYTDESVAALNEAK